MVFPPVTEGDVGETLEVDVPAELLPSDLVHVGGDDDEVPEEEGEETPVLERVHNTHSTHHTTQYTTRYSTQYST